MSKENYWTCLSFVGHHPKDMHCTHKFLGSLQDETLSYVLITINHFIEDLRDNKQFDEDYLLRFSRREFFGEDEDIPVLVPDKGSTEIFDKLSLLRSELDKFRDDDFGEYSPHVTTDEEYFSGRVGKYALMKGEKILAEWRLG